MFVQSDTGFTLASAILCVASAAVVSCASSDVPGYGATSRTAASEQVRCGGFTDDRSVGDILSSRSLESVGPLYMSRNSKTSITQLKGAVLFVRPSRGETAEWLERALQCHSDRLAAAQGLAMAAGNDPFALPGSKPEIAVRSAGDGFRIEISSPQNAEAHDILARAQAFEATANVIANQQLP
jgi:hypothetical protein